MYKITVLTHFDAAHKLESYNGKCHNLHGHRWLVKANYVTKLLNYNTYMAVDFKQVKECLEIVVGKLDHQYLNEFMQQTNPTAEFISMAIYKALLLCKPSGAVEGLELQSVEVWENPECSCEYSEGKNG